MPHKSTFCCLHRGKRSNLLFDPPSLPILMHVSPWPVRWCDWSKDMMLGLTNLAMALDPAELARVALLEPDAWQTKMLRSSSPRLLLNCSRQAGKSTITAILACHTAIYEPESLVLLLSVS